MKRAVLGLKERLPNTTFLCLSNSNEIYISTILEVGPFRKGLTAETQLDQPLLDHHHQSCSLGRKGSVAAAHRASTARHVPAARLRDGLLGQHVQRCRARPVDEG